MSDMTRDEKADRLRQAFFIWTPNTGKSWDECHENEKEHWRSVVDESDKIAGGNDLAIALDHVVELEGAMSQIADLLRPLCEQTMASQATGPWCEVRKALAIAEGEE